MKKESKWGIRIVCVLTGLLMAVGCYAIAAEYGSQSDPLVTLSYINEVLLPQTKSELDEKLTQTVSSYDQTLQQKTQELEQYVDRQVRNYSSGQLDSAVIDQIAAAVVQQMGGASGGSAVWAVVQIPAGGRVTCGVGCQVILRSGAAVCAAAGSPGLVDLSDAETLENGKGLQANHLYIANAEGRGFTSAQGCSVLIAGDYTVA